MVCSADVLLLFDHRQHYLHARNLKEMAALHAQLARAVLQHPPHQQEGLKGNNQQSGLLSEDGAKGLLAPSPFIVQELRKALAAGWADQVSITYIASCQNAWNSALPTTYATEELGQMLDKVAGLQDPAYFLLGAESQLELLL